jgi:hypothetical protein
MDSKLDEILKLTKDNNKMLHKMRRDAMYRSILSTVWWLIFLVAPIIFYYFYLEPYVNQMMQMYATIPGFENLKMPTGGFPDLDQMMQQLQSMTGGGSSTTTGTSTLP